jgi:hypothetical protein
MRLNWFRNQNRHCQKPTTRIDLEMLNTLIAGRRLRDISDLPFDLAV